jgi:hypothetical protein
MGLERVGKEGDFVRYRSAGDIGNVIDLKLRVTPYPFAAMNLCQSN